MGLFYQKQSSPDDKLAGFADAGYLSDPHKARSQTGYVFTCSGATLVATSSTHAELIAIHEASKELFWLN
jgi:hypothetical protein